MSMKRKFGLLAGLTALLGAHGSEAPRMFVPSAKKIREQRIINPPYLVNHPAGSRQHRRHKSRKHETN